MFNSSLYIFIVIYIFVKCYGEIVDLALFKCIYYYLLLLPQGKIGETYSNRRGTLHLLSYLTAISDY